ncbi:COG1361 S-layer family protein [Candidatus Woesearchaeota archaeon]|nr:COG1361 S-layer family protein [Candidatus Woesearchaeota archaeon]
MKNIIFVAVFLIVAVGVSAAVNTQYFGKAPNIIVTLTKHEPDPVEPGKIAEVSFKLDNNGTTAYNLIFEILSEYPFSIVPGEIQPKSIGTLGTSQDGRQSIIVKYKLRVAQDAPDGIHEITARYKTDEFEWIKIENFKIKVQSHDAILAVDKVFTTPPVTAPGDKTKLKIELKNYATSLLKDIKVSLNLDKSETAPFAPVGSTNEMVFSEIGPQSSLPVEFELLVDSDAASKAYKVPLSLAYSDTLNRNYSKTNVVAIIVGDKPDLGVTLERTEIYTSKSSGSVVLRLVNKGNPDIKFLNVKVLQNENIKVIGADEVYVGKLDSDDFSTAEFKLFFNGKESAKIPVEIAYKDANNNDYKELREVELKLYSISEARDFGVKKGNSFGWIVVAVAAVAGLYYYFRKRKKV